MAQRATHRPNEAMHDQHDEHRRSRSGAGGAIPRMMVVIMLAILVQGSSISTVLAQVPESQSGIRYNHVSGQWEAFFEHVTATERVPEQRCSDEEFARRKAARNREDERFWSRYDPQGRWRQSETHRTALLTKCMQDPSCRQERVRIESITSACYALAERPIYYPSRTFVLPCQPWAALHWDGRAWYDAPGREGYLERAGGTGFVLRDDRGRTAGQPMLLTPGEAAIRTFGYQPRLGTVFLLDKREAKVLLLRRSDVCQTCGTGGDAPRGAFTFALPAAYGGSAVDALYVCQAELSDADLEHLYRAWGLFPGDALHPPEEIGEER